MKIYCLNNSHPLSQDILSYFMTLIDDSKLAKIKKYKNCKDYENALIADMMARFSVYESTNISYIKKPFLLTEYGKPYLPAYFNIQFNVSHSSNWVVCAIDEKAIGIDVEHMQDIDILGIVKDFFAPAEYNLISRADSDMRKELFYDIWTLKESYIKALGKGFHIKLDSFSITKVDTMINYQTQIQHEPCYFKQYDIDKSYKLSVCSFSDTFPDDVTCLDINNLYTALKGSTIKV